MAMGKIFRGLVFFFEQIVPVFSFAVIFVSFIIGIFSRYVFNMPVVWTYEVSILAYMWTAYFGASYAYKMNEHVVFGLFYDGRSKAAKKFLRILYNLLIGVFLGMFFWPATTSILARTAKTGSLLWPQKYVFLPFVFMLLAVALRCAFNIYLELTGQSSDNESSDSALVEKAREKLEGEL
ncbi:MAG: TRAP transporter small permease [Planctomycetaceae bacterium]|nr:TRAP transporter small permease [Planctomycetaceae bacterium]